ncbi:MAG TPA: flagellar type III secretion system pore protein FliP [Mycobacterium sp.]|nr:flagellar type III secretion system pore protein FliP [Mycobacterium sp.]
MTALSRRLLVLAFVAVILGFAGLALAGHASAAPTPTPSATRTATPTATATAGATARTPVGPTAPHGPSTPGSDSGTVTVNVGGKPNTSISVLLLITVVSVAPSLLLLMTSFTKIFVVLSITRNALGLTAVPPNQVLAGLSLFVSMFVMGPVLSKVNSLGIQPYLSGKKTQSVAFHDGIAPLRDFMVHHTRSEEIALMLRAGHLPNPAKVADVGLNTLIPAFVLSELRAAMIIGFIIYIPFLIIDMVVSSSLMSLGMMMLPPVTVSLPFKLLLFVLVDGWGLVINSLVSSYNTG